jgi:hypothetical protein
LFALVILSAPFARRISPSKFRGNAQPARRVTAN